MFFCTILRNNKDLFKLEYFRKKYLFEYNVIENNKLM